MRLFLAYDLSQRSKEAVENLALHLQKEGVKGRFVSPDGYHVTIAFLGEQTEETAQKLAELVSRTAFAPSTVPVEKAVCLHGALVLKLQEDKEIFCKVKELRSALTDLNIRFDSKSFYPHVTLARKTDKNAPEFCQSAENMQIELSKIALYQSALTQNGAVYTELAHSTYDPS